MSRMERSDSLRLAVRETTAGDARVFVSWRDPEPFWLHNAAHHHIAAYMSATNLYLTVADEDEAIVGFCCFGSHARVPDIDYERGPVDMGAAMRSLRIAQLHGREFIDTIVTEAERRFPGRILRVTITAFNEHAQQLVWKAGFGETERFTSHGREYVVLFRPAP